MWLLNLIWQTSYLLFILNILSLQNFTKLQNECFIKIFNIYIKIISSSILLNLFDISLPLKIKTFSWVFRNDEFKRLVRISRYICM